MQSLLWRSTDFLTNWAAHGLTLWSNDDVLDSLTSKRLTSPGSTAFAACLCPLSSSWSIAAAAAALTSGKLPSPSRLTSVGTWFSLLGTRAFVSAEVHLGPRLVSRCRAVDSRSTVKPRKSQT